MTCQEVSKSVMLVQFGGPVSAGSVTLFSCWFSTFWEYRTCEWSLIQAFQFLMSEFSTLAHGLVCIPDSLHPSPVSNQTAAGGLNEFPVSNLLSCEKLAN